MRHAPRLPAPLLPAPLLLVALLALAACVPAGPPADPVQVGTCDAERLSAEFVGLPSSVLAATTFTLPIRIVRPGDAVTMDFNPNRINFELDDAGRVARVTCG